MGTNSDNLYTISLPQGENFKAGITSFKITKNYLVKFYNVLTLLHKKGSARVLINFEEYLIKERTHVIMFPNSTISIIEASDDFELYYVGFKPEFMSQKVMRIDTNIISILEKCPCYHHKEDTFELILSITKLIIHFFEEKDNTNSDKIITSFINIIFLDIEDKLKRNINLEYWNETKTGRQEELFKRFMYLVHRNSHLNKEVSFYANELCITPRYLANIVKGVTGDKTAKQIIDENVIAEIKFLLSGNMTIKEIVTYMNFPDQSFMGKYFRKHTGMTLLKFKK